MRKDIEGKYKNSQPIADDDYVLSDEDKEIIERYCIDIEEDIKIVKTKYGFSRELPKEQLKRKEKILEKLISEAS